MLKKICPVCDLPIGATGYCPRCKRVIKKPYLREVNYYLNETHPANELECEFHNRHMESTLPQEKVRSNVRPGGASTGGQPVSRNAGQPAETTGTAGSAKTTAGTGTGRSAGTAGMRPVGNAAGTAGTRPAGSGGTGSQVYRRNPMPNSQTAGQYRTIPNSGYAGQTGTSGSNRGNRTLTKVVAAVLLVSVAALFLIVLGGVSSYMTGDRGGVSEYTEAYDNDEDYYKELTDEEVIAAGVPCLGYTHFPGDSSSIVDTMWDIIKYSSYGYTVSAEESYTDNYVFDGEYSYYEDYRYVNLEDRLTSGMSETDENYIYQSVDFNLDTATGQLHEYSSYLVSRAASLEFLENLLHLMEVNGGVPEEESETAAIMEEAEEIVGQNRNGYIYRGDFVVSIYQGDACLSIVVSYNDQEEGAEVEL